MSLRKQLTAKCQQMGVDLDINMEVGLPDMYAPKGKLFSTNHCHCSAHFYEESTMTRTEVYKEMLEVLENGFIDCDDENCECFRPEV